MECNYHALPMVYVLGRVYNIVFHVECSGAYIFVTVCFYTNFSSVF